MSSFITRSEDENESLKLHKMEKLHSFSVPVDHSVEKEKTRENLIINNSPIG